MKGMRLTKEAERNAEEFDRLYLDSFCECEYFGIMKEFVCEMCSHAGSPMNLYNDESCWEPDFMDIDAAIEEARCRLVEASYAFWALQKLEMLSVFHDAMVRLELRNG